MSRLGLKRAAFIAAMIFALAIALAACGGGSSSSSSAETSTEGTTATTEGSESTETTEGSEGGGGNAAAEAAAKVKPLVEGPSPFPVSEPLKEVPKGAKVIYIDSGTPIGSLLYELLVPAAKTMGVKLEKVTAGLSASTIGPAMDSVVAKQPDTVLDGAVPIELWSKQFKELKEAGATITAVAVKPGEGGLTTIQGTGKPTAG